MVQKNADLWILFIKNSVPDWFFDDSSQLLPYFLGFFPHPKKRIQKFPAPLRVFPTHLDDRPSSWTFPMPLLQRSSDGGDDFFPRRRLTSRLADGWWLDHLLIILNDLFHHQIPCPYQCYSNWIKSHHVFVWGSWESAESFLTKKTGEKVVVGSRPPSVKIRDFCQPTYRDSFWS